MKKQARKAPAFQLYADDFLAGCFELSAEEVGVYIRLLCLQWTKGAISDRLAKSAGGSKKARNFVLEEKFQRDPETGFFRNLRLEQIRRNLEEKRKAGARGGQAKSEGIQAKTAENNSSEASNEVRQQPTKQLAQPLANGLAETEGNTLAKRCPPTPSPTPSSTNLYSKTTTTLLSSPALADWREFVVVVADFGVSRAEEAIGEAQKRFSLEEVAERLEAFRGLPEAERKPGILFNWLTKPRSFAPVSGRQWTPTLRSLERQEDEIERASLIRHGRKKNWKTTQLQAAIVKFENECFAKYQEAKTCTQPHKQTA